jgi:hypothetical protein
MAVTIQYHTRKKQKKKTETVSHKTNHLRKERNPCAAQTWAIPWIEPELL